MNILKHFIIGLFLISFICCEKESQTNPNKAILGKWEMVERGNWPNMDSITNPGGYQEFLSDSTLIYYLNTGEIFQEKYWFDKSYLCFGTPFDSGRQLFIVQYKYQFSNNNNKLRVDIQAPTTIRTSTYKRIN